MPPTGSPHFHIDDDGIGWITFDDPDRRLNVLTEPVMRRLSKVTEEARARSRAGKLRVVVVWSGKPDSFIAGADVDAIADMEDPGETEAKVRLGQAIFMEIETLPVPTVAAIHGVCVGGGTELALACRHRVVSDHPRTRVGLPEVQLGILPAWGGTTRLPRLVGLQAALDLILTGRQMGAAEARRIGFAGAVFPADLFRDKVRAFALTTPNLPRGASLPRRPFLTRLAENTAPGRKVILTAARRRVMARTGGRYPAPLRILDVLGKNLGRSVKTSLDAEARAAGELVTSAVCKNLIHVFRMREAARKGRGVPGGSEVAPVPVGAMGVLGAGTMGGGIAQLAAYNGIRVRMMDIEHAAVSGGLRHARSLFDQAVERGKLTPREAERRMELISAGLDYSGFRALDVVVEAIVEKLDVKKAVLGEVEAHVDEACLLVTNTSSLSVDAMARGLERPDRFCGMHFFNPVHRMPLVEVVRGTATSDLTVATVHALALRLGKIPVVTGDGPGFLVNRILGPYLNEAGFLLADGASVEAVDDAARAFGMPMGPLRLIDEVGIDVSRHAGAALYEALGGRLEPSRPLVALAEAGRLGRKGGKGFYVYEDGREKGVDPQVYLDLAGTIPAERRAMSEGEIRGRLVTQMINEAARVLDEGIVRTAAAVDLALVMGTGFPPFRGGLLRFADMLHPRAVLSRAREFEEAHGPRFTPAPLLARLAEEDRSFYEAFPS